MFSVSRTTFPETVFDTFSQHKDLTKNNRCSTAVSISSDLFPELLSWSAFIDMTQSSRPPSPPPQAMPNDIAEDESLYDNDDNILHIEPEPRDPLILARIFDPTTLAIGFDLSHLNGLDEQLLYAPRDAFIDLCWSDVCPYVPNSLEETLETSSAPSLPSESHPSSIESEFSPSEYHLQPENTNVRVQQFDVSPTRLAPYDVDKTPFIKDQVRDYFFDYSFGQDGVGAFPVPVAKPNNNPTTARTRSRSRAFSTFRPPWVLGRH